MRSVAASLEPKLRRFTTEDLSVYFGDLVDHLDRIWDDLGMYKEIGEGLSDTTYILSTERTNEVIRLLTVIATIMMPITVVASVYGMNVTLPFQNSDYAFLYVILITLAIIGGMLYFSSAFISYKYYERLKSAGSYCGSFCYLPYCC